MSDLNNCRLCGYKKHNHDDSHCYMFRVEPTKPCGHHTVLTFAVANLQRYLASRKVEQGVDS